MDPNLKKVQKEKKGKPRKISQASKKDKNAILQALLDSDLIRSSLIDTIESIDPDVLKRSVHQILNADLDFDPLSEQKRTIDSFLQDTDTVFRFAPAPSGELHIGHVVPILMNLILSRINKNNGRNSTFVIRIDDTDPDILMDRDTVCSGISILDTLEGVCRIDSKKSGIICYNSSDYVVPIVNSVLDSIRSNANKFYPDLTPQAKIKEQRAARQNSDYRDLPHDDIIDLLDRMVSGNVDGVIRAKIDTQSDNGNLRDPVMVRIMKDDDNTVRYFPTYDLVCPLLDLFDSIRYRSDPQIPHTLVALRDCNYYDRLDQYVWIQNALSDCKFISDVSNNVSVTNTAILTFSRINIENVLLSKRGIKSLITRGVVSGWSDPRLFTLPGIMARGFSLAGLANFYWIAGTMSTSNRTSVMTLDNFFALYDKVVCRTSTPILNRIKDSDIFDKKSETLYAASVISYADIVLNSDSRYEDWNTKPKVIGTFVIDLDQIVTDNLTNYKKLDGVLDYQYYNSVGVNAKEIYDDLKASDIGHLFNYGMELQIGTIVKINNFKDDPQEASYPGFYLIKRINHNSKQIILLSISN